MSNALLVLACLALAASAVMSGFRNPHAALVRWGSVIVGWAAVVAGPAFMGVLS